MKTETATQDLSDKLSFQVLTGPCKHQVANDLLGNAKGTPINVKIKVRHKDTNDNKDIFSVENLGHSKNAQKLRLVNSDQTVASFNLLMESETSKKPMKKQQNKILHLFRPGVCFNAQSDDKGYSYTPNPGECSDQKPVISSNHNEETDNFGLRKNFVSDAFVDDPIGRPRMFLGKCKPGGCLDPPFGEDKYSYVPMDKMLLESDNKHNNISKQRGPDSLLPKTCVSKIVPLRLTNVLATDSLVTYPSNVQCEQSSNRLTADIKNLRKISNNTNEIKRNSYLDSYYIPPRNKEVRAMEEISKNNEDNLKNTNEMATASTSIISIITQLSNKCEIDKNQNGTAGDKTIKTSNNKDSMPTEPSNINENSVLKSKILKTSSNASRQNAVETSHIPQTPNKDNGSTIVSEKSIINQPDIIVLAPIKKSVEGSVSTFDSKKYMESNNDGVSTQYINFNQIKNTLDIDIIPSDSSKKNLHKFDSPVIERTSITEFSKKEDSVIKNKNSLITTSILYDASIENGRVTNSASNSAIQSMNSISMLEPIHKSSSQMHSFTPPASQHYSQQLIEKKCNEISQRNKTQDRKQNGNSTVLVNEHENVSVDLKDRNDIKQFKDEHVGDLPKILSKLHNIDKKLSEISDIKYPVPESKGYRSQKLLDSFENKNSTTVSNEKENLLKEKDILPTFQNINNNKETIDSVSLVSNSNEGRVILDWYNNKSDVTKSNESLNEIAAKTPTLLSEYQNINKNQSDMSDNKMFVPESKEDQLDALSDLFTTENDRSKSSSYSTEKTRSSVLIVQKEYLSETSDFKFIEFESNDDRLQNIIPGSLLKQTDSRGNSKKLKDKIIDNYDHIPSTFTDSVFDNRSSRDTAYRNSTNTIRQLKRRQNNDSMNNKSGEKEQNTIISNSSNSTTQIFQSSISHDSLERKISVSSRQSKIQLSHITNDKWLKTLSKKKEESVYNTTTTTNITNIDNSALSKTDPIEYSNNTHILKDNDVIHLDFAFKMFEDKNKRKFLKTFDSETLHNVVTNSNVIFKSAIAPNDNEIRFPIDRDTIFLFQVKRAKNLNINLSDHFESTNKYIDHPSNDKSIYEAAYSELQANISIHALERTITSIYEQNMVPMENMIKSLKEDMEVLVQNQNVLKRMLKNRTEKEKNKTDYVSSVNTKCGCYRNWL